MFRSLQWRIQIWHAIILGAVVASFASVMHMQHRRATLREIDDELTTAVEVLSVRLRSIPPHALRELLNRRGDRSEPLLPDDSSAAEVTSEPPPGGRYGEFGGSEQPDQRQNPGPENLRDGDPSRRPPDQRGRPDGRIRPDQRPEFDDRRDAGGRVGPPDGSAFPGQRGGPDRRVPDDVRPPLERDLEVEVSLQRLPPEARRLMNELVMPPALRPRRRLDAAELPYFVVSTTDGRVIRVSSSFRLLADAPETDLRLPGNNRPLLRTRGIYREAIGSGAPGTVVLAGRSVEPDMNDLNSSLLTLFGVGLSVFVLGLGGGWFLSRGAIRPIRQITEVAAGISARNLSARIDQANMATELGGLSSTLNQTFDRLESAFAQQVRFTADASHELRTPLSVLLMHQELALSRERTPADYQHTLNVCQRAAARMKSLVDSLLTIARADSGGLNLRRRHFELSALVDECAEQLRPLADARQVIIAAGEVSVTLYADRDRIGQVLTNLVANAVAYSPNGSQVTVESRQTAQEVIVAVQDSGPGIPPQDVTRVFERFYRVDHERSRDTGGSGLGLSICQSIMESHGGSISVHNPAEGGSRFEFRLAVGPAPSALPARQ